MDDARFDAFSRGLVNAGDRRNFLRRLAAVAAIGSIGVGVSPDEAEAGEKKRRRRRRCRKKKNRTWCGGTCVRGACCPDKPCGGQFCSCRRSLAGTTFCSLNLAVPCEQCPAAGCEPGFRCVPGECGVAGVTAVCRPECGTDV
jgi:hypothetical protein